MSEPRWQREPGLFKAADAACSYQKTDGFCTPRNVDHCTCWSDADAVMGATGLSAIAVAWVFKHRKSIEASAAEESRR